MCAIKFDAIGTQALGDHTPTRRDTIFRISSMSKPIIAAATMILVEECKLRLDESVDRWLPELAERKVLKRLDGPLDDTVPAQRPITVRDLLTFRMGFGQLMAPPEAYPILQIANEQQIGMGPPSPATMPAPDEWMRRLGQLPLMHQPGEQWMYNTGADVLGVLLARVSGQELPTFLTRDARKQHSQHIGSRVIHPLLPWLVHERELPQTAHPLIRRGHGRRARRPHANLLLIRDLEDRIRLWRRHQLSEAHTKGQQITHRNGPLRGHGVVERPVKSLQDLALSQFWQPAIHGLVQPQLAFFHQDHRRRSDDRLAHRGNAEDGVAPRWSVVAKGLRSDGIKFDSTHFFPISLLASSEKNFSRLALLTIPSRSFSFWRGAHWTENDERAQREADSPSLHVSEGHGVQHYNLAL